MSKKPSAAAIRSAPSLSVVPLGDDRLAVCNVCGEPSEQLGVWRAHDEADLPILGVRALVFIGVDHKACIKRMEAHPRLFEEERGEPGHFPLLCGPCVHRAALRCLHKDLKVNGGAGLKVDIGPSIFGNVIICSRDGCHRPVLRAHACVGREVRS